MKKFLLIIAGCATMILSSNTSYSQTFGEKYYKDGSYIFNDMLKVRQPEIFTTHKSEFGLSENDEMVQTNNVVLADGKFTTKYVLYHKGISVEGSMMNVIGNKGIVQYANGFLLTGLDVDKDNIVTEEEAILAAIDFIGADQYIWEDSTLRAELMEEGEDPDAALYPQHAELLITKKRGEEYEHNIDNYQLCYRVTISAIEPMSRTTVYVNANTGEVFTTAIPTIDDYTAVGTLWTAYNGYHSNIKTRTCTFCSNFWLHDVDRNIYTTRDGKNYSAKGSWNKDNNNNWVESDTKTAASAHWSIQRAWDYFFNRHGRWGSDYAGKRVHMNTETYLGGSNAAFDPNITSEDFLMVRPDFGRSAAMLDVMAHEYTHAMVRASSNLGALGDFEALSLNEGYADIFGMKIEGDVLGSHDWTFAENMGTYQRNFFDPHADFPSPSPSKYLEPGYWGNSIHSNGGVLRKWFHLLSNGGTFNSNTVAPLGIETADDIAYITFNWWLWSNVRYPEMASQTVHATVAHWTKCSNEHKQVVKALRAVGFNIPNPFCFSVGVEGPIVVDPVPGRVFEWKAKLNDIEDQDGTYEWHIPEGWETTVEGNMLFLNSYSSEESQELAVTYTTTDGTISSDTIVVHFSDVEWEPTNNMPVETIKSHFSNEIKEENIMTLYPNPASQRVQLSFSQFEGYAIVEIYDINGRLVKTLNTNQPKVDIDISKFAAGIYLIKAITNERTFTQKLSVLH